MAALRRDRAGVADAPDGLLAEPVPRDPVAFAASAARHGVDPFLLLWLVKDHLRS